MRNTYAFKQTSQDMQHQVQEKKGVNYEKVSPYSLL